MARFKHTPVRPVEGQTGYHVALRHNPSGEVRKVFYPYDWDFSELGADHFLWTEGNNGCDCNRALYFYNWGPESDDRDCGDEMFTALYAELPDGKRIELDDHQV